MFEPNCVVVLLAPELSIKSSAVRAFMQTRLKKNILLSLKNNELEPTKMIFIGGRYLIYSPEPEKVISVLKTVFGIFGLYLAEEKPFSTLEEICALSKVVCEGVMKKGTFAVRGKSFTKEFSSKKLEEEIGGALLDLVPELKVKLKDPQQEFFCITHKGKAIFYFEKSSVAKGMPLGSQGRAGIIVDGYNENEIITLGLNLMKTGCALFLVGSKELQLPKLTEWNSYEKVRFIKFETAKEYYSHDGIKAFFSPAKTIGQADKDSQLVGVKVFAPFLLE
jgi:thiamine biosynthesis protein ThiI